MMVKIANLDWNGNLVFRGQVEIMSELKRQFNEYCLSLNLGLPYISDRSNWNFTELTFREKFFALIFVGFLATATQAEIEINNSSKS